MNKSLPSTLAAAGAVLGAAEKLQAADADKSNPAAAVDVLNDFDWGQPYDKLKPLDEAIAASFGNSEARKAIEQKLVAVLKSNASRAAKDFACRKLMLIGSAASVPTLAAMLADKEMSHMARFALERMEIAEAAKALRDAVATTSGAQKIGVIGSLGARGDAEAVPVLAALLKESNAEIAAAAATALGLIGTASAAQALAGVVPSDAVKPAWTDARLACAEKLLAAGDKVQALAIYKSLNTDDQPKQVRLAATRGMLAAAGAK